VVPNISNFSNAYAAGTLQRIVMETTPITTTNDEYSPELKFPPDQAFMKLSKYIPVGIVNPETLVPGSLKARKRIEKNGYKTRMHPKIKIE